MDMAIQQMTALIDHLRLESLKQQTRCFYCGGLHRTVDCDSPKRDEFMMKLVEVMNTSKMTGNDSGPFDSDDKHDIWEALHDEQDIQIPFRSWPDKSLRGRRVAEVTVVKRTRG
jgi:hypothetical protein